MNNYDKNVFKTLKSEINRIIKTPLKYKDPIKKSSKKVSPFFASLTAKEIFSYSSFLSEGAIMFNHKENPFRCARAKIMVGDYTQGCKGIFTTPLFPNDGNLRVFSREIGRETNEALYDCFKDLNGSLNESIGVPDEFNSLSFLSQEEPSKYHSPERRFKIKKIKQLEQMLKKASKKFDKKEIYTSQINLDARKIKRYFVNSEKTEIMDNQFTLTIRLQAKIRDNSNLILKNGKSFYLRNLKDIPSEEEIGLSVNEIIQELIEMKNAPIQEAGTYPVIMDGENHGVIWHEAVGHSLEAHRSSDDEDEGECWDTDLTFYGKLEKRIAPDFLTVSDDPRLKGHYGSYDYDEEGIPSQETILIEKGILKNYLHSRATAGKFTKKFGGKTNSNGHARSQGIEDPIPRMGVIKVDSTKEHTVQELKKMLVKECKHQQKPYGLLLSKTWGGFTDEGYFRTFPKSIFRIYPSGKTERVRGIYISSTPYQLLEEIVATSDNKSSFEGYCGAESGLIPSTEIAPGAFFKSVEFGRIPRDEYEQRYPLLSKFC